jgi:ribonuclease D
LAVLENLLSFRQQVAQQKDKPLFKILGNQPLLKMAIVKPETMQQLEHLHVLSTRQRQMYGQALLKRVTESLALTEKELPVYPKRKSPKLGGQIPGRIQALKEWRDAEAGKLAIEPSLLCNRSLMRSMAIKNPLHVKQLQDIAKLRKWQIDAFGSDITTVLRKLHT